MPSSGVTNGVVGKTSLCMRGGYLFVACLGHSTVDHASLLRQRCRGGRAGGRGGGGGKRDGGREGKRG